MFIHFLFGQFIIQLSKNIEIWLLFKKNYEPPPPEPEPVPVVEGETPADAPADAPAGWI